MNIHNLHLRQSLQDLYGRKSVKYSLILFVMLGTFSVSQSFGCVCVCVRACMSVRV
jgi:hypothetical protein